MMRKCIHGNQYLMYWKILLVIFIMNVKSLAILHEKRLLSIKAQALPTLCWFPVILSSREVLTACIRRRSATIKHIPSENVQSLLSDMHLCPTQAPVGAMLECAKEVGERGNHLNYGGIYKKEFFSTQAIPWEFTANR